MKNGNFEFSQGKVLGLGALLVLAGCLSANPAFADSSSTRVVPVDQKVFGKTYGEWSAAWWQWAYSIPVPENPFFDELGDRCDEGQSGPVWYLTGVINVSGTATRHCFVPAGKHLFFPVLNFECDNLAPPIIPPLDAAGLADLCDGFMDGAADMLCEVDGVAVENIQNFRVVSPVFSIDFPDNNVFQFFGFDVPAGTYSPFVSDGVFIMLRPLLIGDHTVHFHGSLPAFNFTLDIVYHLTVTPPRRDYEYDVAAAIGDEVPGGGNIIFDFEPTSINNRGDLGFGADVSTGGEGVFIKDRNGRLTLVARSGDAAPGGGTFASFFFITTPLNDRGDLTYHFFLEPVGSPSGVNSAVYRYTRFLNTSTPVFIPGVTPAPGGGTFIGGTIHPSINNWGSIAFSALVSGADIDPGSPPGFDGLGNGIFLQTMRGQIRSAVRPGDAAPMGKTFDFAENPALNDRGDVAFGAHIAGEECIDLGAPQDQRVFCSESVYLKRARGGILSIAHQGSPAPGGGTFRLAFGPEINNRGQVVFVGDLTPAPGFGTDTGIFLYSDGKIVPVARPGDPMPGGGRLTNVGFTIGRYDINNLGDVSFTAALDTGETGVYQWSRGFLNLVARTGTEIPGVGFIVQILPPDLVPFFPDDFPFAWIGGVNNDLGQVLFHAAVDDGGDILQGLLVVASPIRRDKKDQDKDEK